jgi:hypothetical protein
VNCHALVISDDDEALPGIIETADPDLELEYQAWRLLGYMQRRARVLAAERQYFRDDLVQEGMIALWEADPGRGSLDDEVEWKFRIKAINRRMWKAIRAEQFMESTRARMAPRRRGLSYRIPDGRVGMNSVVIRTPTED